MVLLSFGNLSHFEPRSGGTLLLVLTRRVGERLTIGEDIKLTVLAVRNNRVRLGLDAPAEITVVRDEVGEEKAQRLRELAADRSTKSDHSHEE